MKKTILFSIAIFVLSGCGKQLKIQGTADPALDLNGKTITLYVETDTMDATYTTTIENNTFSFRQSLPSPQVTAMRIQDFGNVDVVLEQGTIRCALLAENDTQGTFSKRAICTGTPNNDLLKAFQEEDANLTARYEAATDAATRQSIEEEYTRFVYDFIVRNINTIASCHVFTQSYWLFDIEQCGAILEQLTPESMEYGKILAIYAAWKAQKTTSAGERYTDFALTTPEGNTLALSDLIGTTPYILVDFWASWCGPCRASMPAMRDLYARHQEHLQILGVSLDKDKNAWTEAIEVLGLKWLHASDLQGWKSEAAQLYGINSIPATILIDNQGVIVGRNLSAQELESLLSATK